MQQLFKWLTDDGEIVRSPMERMSPPSVPEQPVPILDDAALSALLASCKGNTFENRRDTAIVRLLLGTGMQAGELCGLRLENVRFEHQIALVLGKGGRNRACPFGSKTADALRRYLRFRGRHDAAETPPFWLGKRGRRTGSGLRRLTNELADQIAEETLAEVRRRNLIPGGKSLSGGGVHSPRVQFRVPQDLREQAERVAEDEGVSLSALARQALEDYLRSRAC